LRLYIVLGFCCRSSFGTGRVVLALFALVATERPFSRFFRIWSLSLLGFWRLGLMMLLFLRIICFFGKGRNEEFSVLALFLGLVLFIAPHLLLRTSPFLDELKAFMRDALLCLICCNSLRLLSCVQPLSNVSRLVLALLLDFLLALLLGPFC